MCGPHPLQPETFLNEFDTISGSSLKTVGATAPFAPVPTPLSRLSTGLARRNRRQCFRGGWLPTRVQSSSEVTSTYVHETRTIQTLVVSPICCHHPTWYSTLTRRLTAVVIRWVWSWHSLIVRRIASQSSRPAGAISDHALVTCQLPVGVDLPPLTERLARCCRHVDRDQLRRALEANQHCANAPPDSDADQLFDAYNRGHCYNVALFNAANRFAPAHTIRRRPGCPTPWFDAACNSDAAIEETGSGRREYIE